MTRSSAVRPDLSLARVSPTQRTYLAKDQRKSDAATCLLATPGSAGATGEYLRVWLEAGGRANDPRPGDVCFVSANGRREGARPPPLALVRRAHSLGCEFLTDAPSGRAAAYNVGERAVAEELRALGLVEFGGLASRWRRRVFTAATNGGF